MHYKFITSLVCTYIFKILFHRSAKIWGGGQGVYPPQKFPIQFLTDDWYALIPLSLNNLQETLLSTFKQTGLRFWGVGST